MYKKAYNILIIILLLLLLAGCLEKKVERDHVVFNNELSPYIVIQGSSYNIYNFEDKLEQTTTFRMYLNIDSLEKEETTKNINYELTAINVLEEQTKYKSNKTMSIPLNDQLLFNTNIGGNGFKEFFLKINNSIEYKFYENVIHTTSQEIRYSPYPEEFISDVVSIDFNIIEDSEKYHIEFLIDSKENIHLDLQTFLVSEDARVYSFLGLYGYNRNVFPYNIKDNYIYKDMNLKYIYLRLQYYKEDETKIEIRSRLLINDLLEAK